MEKVGKIIRIFIYTGIVHGMIKLIGANGRYADTFNACTYSLIPWTIISVIPIIWLLVIIYSIVLMTIGLSIYHSISKTKAAFSAIIPIAVLVGIIVLWIIWFFSRAG